MSPIVLAYWVLVSFASNGNMDVGSLRFSSEQECEQVKAMVLAGADHMKKHYQEWPNGFIVGCGKVEPPPTKEK